VGGRRWACLYVRASAEIERQDWTGKWQRAAGRSGMDGVVFGSSFRCRRYYGW
jgi:hypothetical protein